jgi:hypothetical protein
MKLTTLLLAISTLVITGCATSPKPMYDYGEYSQSFYAMKRETGTETEAQWRGVLENIIVRSKEIDVRVPPGVYANLGYLHLKMNEKTKAVDYFELEKSVYPESVQFMDRLINRVNTQS